MDRKEILMIEVPISNGELLDKLSILEVNQQNGISEVEDEIDLLLEIVENQDWWSIPHVWVYYRMLCTLNSEIWEVEDRKREHEQEKDFGEEFIELSRCVYIIKDERTRLKKLINKYTDSKLLDHKQPRSY